MPVDLPQYGWYQSETDWTLVAELDLSEPNYSFDLLVVWINKDGRVVYATDSGCSCPSPFEDHQADDYKEFSWTAVNDIIAGDEDSYRSGGYPLAEDVARFKDKLKSYGI